MRTIALLSLLLTCVLPASHAVDAGAEEAALKRGLTAYYPLLEDANDHSGNGLNGTAHGVGFDAEDGARFDGRGAYIEVPDNPALDFGDKPFSIAAWVHTAFDVTDAFGDILGKFDGDTRRGFNFVLQDFTGVGTTQANARNLFFGVDDGTEAEAWVDRGRPGNAQMVFALCVFEGALYAGTFEGGAGERGHIYRLENGDTWVECGAPHPSNAITSLAVHNGKLYAGASHYRSRGSSLEESENTTDGGQIYRYEGNNEWSDMGKIGESEAVGGMASFEGDLYASSLYAPPGLFRYSPGKGWIDLGNPGARVVALGIHDGAIYGSGYDIDYGGVYRFDSEESTWTDCGTSADTTQTYSFATHRGRLFVGTWPSGRVYRYGGEQSWENTGQLGEELEVMGMAVYNGKLYGGTLPLAEVYRYDGDGNWHNTGRIDHTPDVKYRRAWSMAVYNGQLFCGTLPSGHVWSLQTGQGVSHDASLKPGLRHVAATRDGNTLTLYAEGEVVGKRSVGDGAITVDNDAPMTLGFGAHDYFNGRIKDLRIYNRALEAADVATLFHAKAGKSPLLDFPLACNFDPNTIDAPLSEAHAWRMTDYTGTGEVHAADGVATIGQGNDMSGIVWTGDLIRMNYEITLDAMRTEGEDFFCGLTFPYGDDPCSLICGGWGGTLVGLSSLDYYDAYNNETARFREFENDRWYAIRLRATPSRIEAWIDEEQMVNVETKGRTIGIRWEMEKIVPLGIATWRTTGAVRDIKIRAIGDPEAPRE